MDTETLVRIQYPTPINNVKKYFEKGTSDYIIRGYHYYMSTDVMGWGVCNDTPVLLKVLLVLYFMLLLTIWKDRSYPSWVGVL